MGPDRLLQYLISDILSGSTIVTAPVPGIVASIVVVSGRAGRLRLQPRFVVTTTLVSAFVSLPDGIIAILIAVEQASQLLLPVLRRRCLHYSGRGSSKRQSEKYG